MKYTAPLEGLLFVAGDEGLSKKEIIEILELKEDEFDSVISSLFKINEESERGIKVIFLGEKYKLVTKEEYKEYYKKLIDNTNIYKLSPAALETLAIIAYYQPVTRAEIDELRGVYSSHILRRLVSLEIIKESAKSNLPGRPYLYETTSLFLDYFNLGSLKELPNIENIEIEIEEELYKSGYNDN